ncbi:MAG: D-tyrosyl-tRNA(Tyr) deacylase [bacterium P3]|nr:MAG: D-tyrosyl-tRNA(Tyr) deacylase [bacterium P3]KWW40769.1 MAG: D-tyrosyl-tRNA(Tyr) deacylase [bacterium F083]
MRIVIQRVRHAAVSIAGRTCASIGSGMLILLGVEDADTDADIEWLCRKTIALRIFDDNDGVMNLPVTSLHDGGIIVVSQFTLMASTRKGNRPSYIRASRPEVALPLYNRFVERLSELYGHPVQTGVFGADMQVSLLNDGPVTIIIDSHDRQ